MENPASVLVIENNEPLHQQLEDWLQKWGLTVFWQKNPEQALQQISEQGIQLVLLDVPSLADPQLLTEEIRSFSKVPILWMAPAGTEVLPAVQAGADDVLLFPISEEQMQARIAGLHRRAYEYRTPCQLDLGGGLLWDPENFSLSWKAQNIPLTQTEQKILTRLCSVKGTAVSRDDLMMLLWNTREYINDGTLSTCISRLRTKLRKLTGQDLIVTRKGKGYLIP